MSGRCGDAGAGILDRFSDQLWLRRFVFRRPLPDTGCEVNDSECCAGPVEDAEVADDGGPVSGGVRAVIGDAVTVSALDPGDQVAGFQNEARPRPADW